jgi:HlyD family secretion protein
MVSSHDCSEFGLALRAKPPAIVHGTAVLLVLFLALATVWLGCTEADMVVRVPGRVRPADNPKKIYTPADMEGLGPVAAILVREGDRVRAGATVLQLDTSLVDNQIAKLRQTVETAQQELLGIEQLMELLEEQRAGARAKATALLNQAVDRLNADQQRQQSDIRAAESKLAALDQRWQRTEQLVRSKASSQQQLDEILAQREQATEELAKARLPVDTGQVDVVRRELGYLEREYELKAAELAQQRLAHRREIETATKELANLQIKRESAVLRAPIDGVVISGRINERDVLAPGTAIFEVAPSGGYRFEAVVPSANAGQLHCGMSVKVKFFAYDYQRYGVATGKVSFVSPDSQVVPSTAGQASADVAFSVYTELDQRQLRRNELVGDIKLGMSGVAEIVTRRDSLLSILFQTIRHTVSLG